MTSCAPRAQGPQWTQSPRTLNGQGTGRAQAQGRVSSHVGLRLKALSGTMFRSVQYKYTSWRPTHCSDHRRTVRSVLRVSLELSSQRSFLHTTKGQNDILNNEQKKTHQQITQDNLSNWLFDKHDMMTTCTNDIHV